MTERDRRLAKAERLREWADKRETRAAAVFASHKPYTSDNAFNTQPGHIPFRARINAAEDREHASLQKARQMSSRADGIEAAADRAIYSDDEDACDMLRARIAEHEAERARIVAFNKAFRKTKPTDAHAVEALLAEHLDERQRANYLQLARIGMRRPDGTFPGYATSNLSGRIKTDRDRLARLEHQ